MINLNRHPQRMARMRSLLRGVDFERVCATDGRDLEGPEVRYGSAPKRFEKLTRYERACTRSHAVAWQRLLDSGASHGCILEDDVILSPDFPAFAADAAWIPADCDVLKIETFLQPLLIKKRRRQPGRDRWVTRVCSTHYGAAGYILNRRAATALVKHAMRPPRPVDHMLFDVPPLFRALRVRQLLPALCLQTRHVRNGPDFPELASAIQLLPEALPPPPPGWVESLLSNAASLFLSVASGRTFVARREIVPFC